MRTALSLSSVIHELRLLRKEIRMTRPIQLNPYTCPRIPISKIIEIMRYAKHRQAYRELITNMTYHIYCHVPENRAVIYGSFAKTAFVYSVHGLNEESERVVLDNMYNVLTFVIEALYSDGKFPFMEEDDIIHVRSLFITEEHALKSAIGHVISSATMDVTSELHTTWFMMYPDKLNKLIKENEYKLTMHVAAMPPPQPRQR